MRMITAFLAFKPERFTSDIYFMYKGWQLWTDDAEPQYPGICLVWKDAGTRELQSKWSKAARDSVNCRINFAETFTIGITEELEGQMQLFRPFPFDRRTAGS